MNTMQSFYASISSVPKLHGSYLDILFKITRISLRQSKSLRSELGWQSW